MTTFTRTRVVWNSSLAPSILRKAAKPFEKSLEKTLMLLVLSLLLILTIFIKIIILSKNHSTSQGKINMKEIVITEAEQRMYHC